MPTGIAIRDPRQQLFGAAERVLLRDGPSALTSRAVTNEAGFAKGVLHRHFADFDAFLAALIADRIERIGKETDQLVSLAGSGSVVENVSAALLQLFGSVAGAMVGLLIFRDDLRRRIRQEQPSGIPVLHEGRAMIVAYLAKEREIGRIAPGTDLEAISRILIATAAMDFADRPGENPETLVSTVLAPGLVVQD
jgi:AcrR family transcriptional regulator